MQSYSAHKFYSINILRILLPLLQASDTDSNFALYRHIPGSVHHNNNKETAFMIRDRFIE